MLRLVVILFGVLMLLGGLLPLALWGWPILPLVVLGALVLVGTLYERFRYRLVHATAPGPGWQATDERFIDDETGKRVTVYVKPDTGERRYVNS